MQWRASSAPDTTVVLLRTLVQPAPIGRPSTTRLGAVSPATAEPVTVRLLATQHGHDPGGTLDPSAIRDASYTYIAWRERSASLKGQTLVLRSVPSATLSVQIRDLTPPKPPTGLEAIAYGSSADLSWHPNAEADLAGYLVDRAPASKTADSASLVPNARWTRLTDTPLFSPGFHDTLDAVPARYLYRVLAVDTSGNIGEPSTSTLVEIHAEPSAP